MHSIVFNNYGPSDVLQIIEEKEPDLTGSKVLVKHTAIGVNRIDIRYRQGEYKLPSLPSKCGIEACGIIEKIGPEVNGYEVGDKVVYTTGPLGSYSTKRVIDAKYLIKAPVDISDEVLAASFSKAMTAHYLVHRAFIVTMGLGVLVHNAESVIGQYISSWASSLGALVIGTVASDKNKQLALDCGCHQVFNYKTEDWVAGVMKHTEGFALNAVYESIGIETFEKSLQCLRMCGILISYDSTSGPVKSVSLRALTNKSLFLTCPTLKDYKSNRKELLLSAEEVFARIRDESLPAKVSAKFKLEEASKAHQALEQDDTGSIILVP